ncbi:MAG TPA: HlyD family efflux transporter periplasmic adaptor subunit [Bryobacteraceae bacterium]|jgi:multidrug resistance efflux pump
MSPAAPVQTLPPSPHVAINRNWLGFGALTLLLASLAAGWWIWLRPAANGSPVETQKTAFVTAGPLERTIRLNGQTTAGNFYTITAPIKRGPESGGNMVILKMAKGGSLVKRGDIVLAIDGRSMADHVDDVRDQLHQGENDVAKRKAEQAVEMGQLLQTLKIAKSQWDKAKLDAQPAPVRTDIERELMKLAVDEAEARYKQQLKDLEQKKASQAAEIRILEETVARHKIHLMRHEIDLTRFTVRASAPGMIVTQPIYRGGDMAQIDEGDQVYAGMPVLKVVDPASLQVEAQVNQAQSSQLRIGQRVRIGFDAFANLQLTGRVYSIGALAISSTGRSQYFIRTVPVRITFDERDPRVIPDLSAYAEVITDRDENALQVPLSAIGKQDGRPYVWVRNPSGAFEKRFVTLGLESYTRIAVKDGLRAGDEVRVID